jgi:parallel beta-helix repeat protein
MFDDVLADVGQPRNAYNNMLDEFLARSHNSDGSIKEQSIGLAQLATEVTEAMESGAVGGAFILPTIANTGSSASVKAIAVAVCDGTADQVEINAALATYGVVSLAPGAYTCSAAVVMPSGGRILGTPGKVTLVRNGTLVSSNAHGINIVGISGNEVTDTYIYGLILSGPSATGARVAGNGVNIAYANRVRIDRCIVTNFGSNGDDGGVGCTYASNIRITHSEFYDNLNGPIFGKAGGVVAPNVSNVTLADNVFRNNWADGAHGQNSDRLNFIGNTCYSNGESGIDLLGCYDCVISGNICYSNGHEGIEIGQTVSTGREDRGHSITGNVCTGNHTIGGSGGGGILLGGKTSFCTVSGNTCRLNTNHGIHVGNTGGSYLVEKNLIIGNTCITNTAVGIHLSGAANGNVVQGNHVRENGTRGIDMTTSGVTPLGTIVKYNVLGDNVAEEIYRSGGLPADTTTIVEGNIGYP